VGCYNVTASRDSKGFRGTVRAGLQWVDRTAPWAGLVLRRARTRAWLRREIRSGRYLPTPPFVSHYADYEHSAASDRIPRRWHATWKSSDLPDEFRRNFERLRELHPAPAWTHRVWSDDEIMDFAQTHYPDRKDAFEALPKHIMRVDLFRYMVMFVQGGVYSDLDVWMFRSIDELLADARLVLAAETDVVTDPNFIAQHFLSSVPGHPFWEDLLHAALDRPLDAIRGYGDPVSATGPVFVTRIWRASAAKYRAKVVPRVCLCPPAMLRRQGFTLPSQCYGIHECVGTWR